MNKTLYYLKNITFGVVNILFFLSFSHLSMVMDGQINYTLLCTLLFIGTIIQLIILWRRHSKVNKNNWYNGLFLATNILFIGLFLRTRFDISIVTVYLHHSFGLSDEPYLFLYYNLGWISLLYTILMIYPFTYLKLKKKKNEK